MRAPPNAVRAAPALAGNGSLEKGRLAGATNSINSDSFPARQTLADAQDRADDLLALSHWRKNLEWRLRLARLRFEYIGLDVDEQDALAAEIHGFRDLCAAMHVAVVGDVGERRAS